MILEVLKTADHLELLTSMSIKGINHTLMPAVCAPSGLKCFENTPVCAEIQNIHIDLKGGMMAIKGVASVTCMKEGFPGWERKTLATTTSTSMSEQAVTSFAMSMVWGVGGTMMNALIFSAIYVSS